MSELMIGTLIISVFHFYKYTEIISVYLLIYKLFSFPYIYWNKYRNQNQLKYRSVVWIHIESHWSLMDYLEKLSIFEGDEIVVDGFCLKFICWLISSLRHTYCSAFFKHLFSRIARENRYSKFCYPPTFSRHYFADHSNVIVSLNVRDVFDI